MENAKSPIWGLFFGIWLHPRASVREAVDRELYFLAFIFAILGSVSQSIGKMIDKSLGDTYGMPLLLRVAVVSGLLGGTIGLCFISWLVRYTGSWLGGTGKFGQLMIAVGWGNIPIAWVLLLDIIMIAMFGQSLFTSDGPIINSLGQSLVLLLIAVLMIVAGVWATITLCKAVGEAHGFSAWRGLGSLLLAILVLLVPVILIAIVIGTVTAVT